MKKLDELIYMLKEKSSPICSGKDILTIEALEEIRDEIQELKKEKHSSAVMFSPKGIDVGLKWKN